MVQALPGRQGQTFMQVPVSGTRGLQQIQLVPPGQIQIQGGQAVQVQCQTQQIIIQQPDGHHCWPDTDTAADCSPGAASGTDC